MTREIFLTKMIKLIRQYETEHDNNACCVEVVFFEKEPTTRAIYNGGDWEMVIGTSE